MTYRVVLFAYRKPGMTPETFKHLYETVHLPLVKNMSGNLFPISHTRRYVSRPANDNGEPFAAQLISGKPEDVKFDAITEMVFESAAQFYEFAGVLAEPANEKKIQEDCAAFLDTSLAPTMIVLDELCEHTRD
ncbi:hypothetical protein CC79DRAFT_865373 [Sarocladium strictum]